jgi:mRNA interferase MazF
VTRARRATRPTPAFRLLLEPSAANGLRAVSPGMADNSASLKREKIGEAFGRLDDETLLRVNRALAVWLGVA